MRPSRILGLGQGKGHFTRFYNNRHHRSSTTRRSNRGLRVLPLLPTNTRIQAPVPVPVPAPAQRHLPLQKPRDYVPQQQTHVPQQQTHVPQQRIQVPQQRTHAPQQRIQVPQQRTRTSSRKRIVAPNPAAHLDDECVQFGFSYGDIANDAVANAQVVDRNTLETRTKSDRNIRLMDAIADGIRASKPLLHHFEIIRSPGDGDCFFHSMATWMQLYRLNPCDTREPMHVRLRRMVYGFYQRFKQDDAKMLYKTDLDSHALANINAIIGIVEHRDDEHHAADVYNRGHYGNNLDAAVLAYLLQINVVIVNNEEKNKFQPVTAIACDSPDQPTFYLLHSGNHFDALYPKRGTGAIVAQMRQSINPLLLK